MLYNLMGSFINFSFIHNLWENPMSLVDLIKTTREKKGWTQKQLADAIGVSQSFITKVEGGESFPSYERCVALANVLDLSLDKLWAEVEKDKTEIFQQRVRKREEAVHTAFGTRGGEQVSTSPTLRVSEEELVRNLTADPELQSAYHRALQNLKIALADPEMRPTVFAALEAFARTARPKRRK